MSESASDASGSAPKRRRRRGGEASQLSNTSFADMRSQWKRSGTARANAHASIPTSYTAAISAIEVDLIPSQVRTSPAFKRALAERHAKVAASRPTPVNMRDNVFGARPSSTGASHWKAQPSLNLSTSIEFDETIAACFNQAKFLSAKSNFARYLSGTSAKSAIRIESERATTWKDLAVVGRKLSYIEFIRWRWLKKQYGERALGAHTKIVMHVAAREFCTLKLR